MIPGTEITMLHDTVAAAWQIANDGDAPAGDGKLANAERRVEELVAQGVSWAAELLELYRLGRREFASLYPAPCPPDRRPESPFRVPEAWRLTPEERAAVTPPSRGRRRRRGT